MTDENTLPAAKRLLEDAVAALIDPRPLTHNNRLVWIDSVYTELRDAIHGHKTNSTRQPSEPQPPLWIDGIDLANDIDSTVRGWEPNPAGCQHPTVNRLRAIAARSWRPQDTTFVEDMALLITAWVRRYRTLIDPKPKSLPNACPVCGNTHAHRMVDGERVRVPALSVTPERCVCLVCKTQWPAARFGLLARQLGYAPPEGVIQP